MTQKDGSQRFCVDYSQVNAVTVKDAYSLPPIDDSLSALSGPNMVQLVRIVFRVLASLHGSS